MAREVVIGVDIGTTSAKAVAFDARGGLHAAAQCGYALHAPQPGRAEQDALDVLAAAERALAEAVRDVRGAGCEVVGLGGSSAMHGLVGLGADGAPVTPLLTYADRRAADQAARLRSDPRGLAMHRRTGTPVHPMSPLLKLRWFAEREPETFAAAERWCTVKDLLTERLTGRWVTDHGLASGTGLFHLGEETWDMEALAYAGIGAERLPLPVPTTTALAIEPAARERLGLGPDVPWVVGGADGPMANLGVGAVAPGTAACSIGTSGALRVVSDRPRVDPRGRTFCYVLAPGLWVVGGAINNGGIVLDWAAGALAPELTAAVADEGGRPPEALLELAAEAEAGAGGLLFLPHLLGERAPHWSGNPRGAFIGLTGAHRREHLLRAMIEGVCLQLAVVLAALGEADVEVMRIRATGGFSRSALWRRVLAAALGRPVAFARSPEGSGLGAALLAWHALGRMDDLTAAADLVEIVTVERPDRHEAERYARLLAIFERAQDALGPTFEDLHDFGADLPP